VASAEESGWNHLAGDSSYCADQSKLRQTLSSLSKVGIETRRNTTEFCYFMYSYILFYQNRLYFILGTSQTLKNKQEFSLSVYCDVRRSDVRENSKCHSSVINF
jgi:hypothetical protein